MVTPFYQLHFGKFDLFRKIEIFVKREDLYPMCGGGNKVRKNENIFATIADNNCNAIVTNGGMQSNHARVVALMAAARGWRCRLILHGDPREIQYPEGNLLLMVLAGAEIIATQPDRIPIEIESSMNELRKEGFRPFQIPGGGHCLEGAISYLEVVNEIGVQIEECEPEFIILASGTGTTQAGIQAGVDQKGWKTRVIGISVARKNPRGSKITQDAYHELCKHLRVPIPSGQNEFRDDWVGEGYGIPNDNILETIRKVACDTGLILDPTYTGKAFYGLESMVRSGEIPSQSHVVFVHTGGLINLCASHRLFRNNNGLL